MICLGDQLYLYLWTRLPLPERGIHYGILGIRQTQVTVEKRERDVG